MYNLYNQTDVTNLKQALENLKAEIEAQQRREKARLDEAYKQGQLSAKNEAARVAQELTPEWIWNWLMDYCQRRSVSPATHDSLFQMVKDARALLAQAAPPAAKSEAASQPLQLPEGMSRDESLEYYSQYANLCANEALMYQKTIRDLEAKLAASQPGEMAAGVSYEDEMAQTLGFKNALDAVVWAGFMKGASAQQDEREAFEVIAKDQCLPLSHTGITYDDISTQAAWAVYRQARTTRQVQANKGE